MKTLRQSETIRKRHKSSIKNTWKIIIVAIGNMKNKQKYLPEKLITNNIKVAEKQDIAENNLKHLILQITKSS